MGPRGSSLPSLGGRECLLEKVVPKQNLKRYVVVSPEEGNWFLGKGAVHAKAQGQEHMVFWELQVVQHCWTLSAKGVDFSSQCCTGPQIRP